MFCPFSVCHFVNDGAGRGQPRRQLRYWLEDAAEQTASSATATIVLVLVLVVATLLLAALVAAGQPAGEAAHGVLHLVERTSALATGQPTGESTDGVLHLVERAATALLLFAFLLAFAAFPIGGTVVVLGVAGLHGGRRALHGWKKIQPEETTAEEALLTLLLFDRRRVGVRAGGVLHGLLGHFLVLDGLGDDFLVHQVALRVVDPVDDVALLIDLAPDGHPIALFVLGFDDPVTLFVGGRLANYLVTLGQGLGHLARHILGFFFLLSLFFGLFFSTLFDDVLVQEVALRVEDRVDGAASLVGRAPDDRGVALFVLALKDGVSLIVGKRLAQRLVSLGQALSHLARQVLCLVRRLTYGFLGLIRDLADLIGCLSGSVLHLIGKPTNGVLGLIRHLSGLISNLTDGILSLVRNLLRLLGRHVGRALARGLIGVLPGLLRRLQHRILHTRVLGSLGYGARELVVGVGHLLDLGLRILRELLHVVVQLDVVAFHLTQDPAHRLPEEVPGLLQDLLILRLLLNVLLLAHLCSFSFCGSRLTCSTLTSGLSLPFSAPNYSQNRKCFLRPRWLYATGFQRRDRRRPPEPRRADWRACSSTPSCAWCFPGSSPPDPAPSRSATRASLR